MTMAARLWLIGILGCAAACTPAAASGTRLTLVNGWKPYGINTARPEAYLIKNIVHLKGAIKTSHESNEPFVLPAPFRPETTVTLKVDLCDTTNGRLTIAPDGTATIDAEKEFSDAQCFTSLEGVTYALATGTFKPVNLINGWQNFGNDTAPAVVRNLGGTVRLAGAIATGGTNPVPFILPAALRPATTVYVAADMSGPTNGRLEIDPDGTVTAQAENTFSDAASYTSLEGVSYALGSSGFTSLTLINGWAVYPDSTAPAVKVVDKIVQFRGAMKTIEDNPAPFVLPAAARPAKTVFVPVDLCTAHNGRLEINPDGSVSVEAEDDVFGYAQCFTSLDGVSFHL